VSNPFIIQKQDGGFNYATTDLATLAYRLQTWQAQEIAYVTDGSSNCTFTNCSPPIGDGIRSESKAGACWFGSILVKWQTIQNPLRGNGSTLGIMDEAEERL